MHYELLILNALLVLDLRYCAPLGESRAGLEARCFAIAHSPHKKRLYLPFQQYYLQVSSSTSTKFLRIVQESSAASSAFTYRHT